MTGNYYYGARYYDPQVSVWFISVDPLATKYPYVTPYNFVENNPIILVVPDGKGLYVYEEIEGGGYQKVENIENDVGEHPRVEKLYYLGALDEKGVRHAQIFEKQCLSKGAMLSFDVKGGGS